MDSFFATYYLDLQHRIQSEVSGIKTVEPDYGQANKDKWLSAANLPSVLIDFSETVYENIVLGGTTANVELTLRLMTDIYLPNHEYTHEEIQNRALRYFELEHQLAKALHGWQPDSGYVQPLMLSRVYTSNDNGQKTRLLKFTTSYEEYVEKGKSFDISVPKWQ